MQKVISRISRFVFVGVIVMLLLAVAIGEVLFIKNKKLDIGSSTLAKTKINVVLANSASDESIDEEVIEDKISGDDARPLIIKRYLEKYKSPLAPYSDLIFELSQTYGYDYYWIVAIAQQESNLCKKIPEDSHNCWGYGIHKNGTLKFENYELALRSYAEYLKRQYFDKGLNTAELIMKKYCPSSNGSWAYGVNHFINEMESGKF